VNACPLYTLDGRREALDRQRMSIRGPNGVGAERPRHRRSSAGVVFFAIR